MTDLDELERKARAYTNAKIAIRQNYACAEHDALIKTYCDYRAALVNPAVILALIERVRAAERSERIARTNACILLKKLDDAQAWEGTPAELRQRVAKALWAAAPKRGLLAETKWEDIEPGWKLAFLSAADTALEALGLAEVRAAEARKPEET